MADETEETAEKQASQDDRLTRLEATQAEQGGKLDQILNLIKGEGPEHEAAQAHTEDRLDQSSTIADQVRQAVRDVHAERDQADADAKHKADHEAIREKPPRESQSGWRGKLQAAMYGGDPK